MQYLLIIITASSLNVTKIQGNSKTSIYNQTNPTVNITRFDTLRQCEEIKNIITKTFDANIKLGHEKTSMPAIGCYKLTTPKGM